MPPSLKIALTAKPDLVGPNASFKIGLYPAGGVVDIDCLQPTRQQFNQGLAYRLAVARCRGRVPEPRMQRRGCSRVVKWVCRVGIG